MKFRESISYLLARINTAHKTALERSMNEIGLHSGQVFVLLELWKNNGLRQIDLAERLKIAPPTVNKTLKGMIDSGFVTRTKVEDDARSTRIFLTERGAAIEAEVHTQWERLEEQLLARLTDTEMLVLFQLLEKLGPEEIDEDDDV
jgi:DNA-binding MarR family transcriptional regulator